jgi:hypothetical protein
MTKQDKEQAPDKPKVQFIMKFDIWDDGEITRDLIEKVQGERGAPKLWRLEPRDFASSIKANKHDKIKVFEQLLAALDIPLDEMKKAYSLDGATHAKMEKIASAFSSKGLDDEKAAVEGEFNFDKE